MTLMQEYVDHHLVGTGNCKWAIIIGHDASIWASSCFFTGIRIDEAKKLVNAFYNPGSAFASGLHLGDIKYMITKADVHSVYGKKDYTGFCAVRTNQCILIGLYDETIQPDQCANAVEKLADYFIENSY